MDGILTLRNSLKAWAYVFPPDSKAGYLIYEFLKEADKREKMEILQDALSGLESFIDYKAWAITYQDNDSQTPDPKTKAEVDPAVIDRLAGLKEVPKDKQKEEEEKLKNLLHMQRS